MDILSLTTIYKLIPYTKYIFEFNILNFSVLYSEGLAPKNPMLPSAGTLDNVTKTIGRLLDGYDIRLRPNFGGKFINILVFKDVYDTYFSF